MTPLSTAEPSQRDSAVAETPPGFWNQHSPAVLAAGLYVLCSAGILIASYFFYCDRHFIYAMDDTYISMAMGKNLALHGVWGVSPYAFSSSNSSPVYPLMLAALYLVTGVNRFAPLALSWTFGLLSIFVAERMLARYLGRKGLTLSLILFVAFTPLFVVGVLGMEHSFHLLITLLFLGYFLDGRTEGMSGKQLLMLGSVTALMVSARYEALFFVLPAGCVLLAQRRWKPLFSVCAGAAVPVLAYAAFSMAHGGYWLPNSVALKGAQGDHPSLMQMGANIMQRIVENYNEGFQLFWLLALVGIVMLTLLFRARQRAIPLFLIFVAGCLHIALAQVGMYYRYDAYLFGAAVVALACALPATMRLVSKPVSAGIYGLGLATGIMLLLVGLAGMHMIPRIARNIYLRQYQMARFVHEYYPTGVVAANDIGAVNYFSNMHCYDFVGLANPEVFAARRSGRYTTEFLLNDTEAQHVQIAIAYDRWFADPLPLPIGGPPLPQNWMRVARWYIPDPTIVGDVYVSFYAVDPSQAATLRADVQQFASKLPPVVKTLPD